MFIRFFHFEKSNFPLVLNWLASPPVIAITRRWFFSRAVLMRATMYGA